MSLPRSVAFLTFAAMRLPLAVLALLTVSAWAGEQPLMRDFMGLNVHTVQFKPDLYAPVTRVLRNYHPFSWDVGKDTAAPLDFPFAKNRVHWSSLYGAWKKAGYRTHASIMIDDTKPAAWKDLEADAEKYGREFAKHFGPSSADGLLEAAEVGNEPGGYSDEEYRKVFTGMAKGLRSGDPALKISTCAATTGKSGKYAKSVACFDGLNALWDILNIHVYAEVEPWPTWRRSYPEDPATKFVTTVTEALAWRDQHAAGKQLWVTEFGYDASTQAPPKTGDFAKWQGNSEEQQAEWITRSYLLLARHGVDRAHLFFFNDDDQPQLHGSSGLTRKFQPKPAFHAVAWLLRSLGEYRFARVEREDAGDCYAYEFVHGQDAKRRVWAVWKPAGEPRVTRLFHDPHEIVKAERMPLIAGAAEAVEPKREIEGYFAIEASEKPVLVWLGAR
jgi:hypothetical protein